MCRPADVSVSACSSAAISAAEIFKGTDILLGYTAMAFKSEEVQRLPTLIKRCSTGVAALENVAMFAVVGAVASNNRVAPGMRDNRAGFLQLLSNESPVAASYLSHRPCHIALYSLVASSLPQRTSTAS